MSERARELADHFERANDDFIAVVEPLSDEAWRTYCPEEGRTVAALAHHVAEGYRVEIDAFQAIAEGRPVNAWTRESLDAQNAADGRDYAECDKTECLQLLRRNAEHAAGVVRSLSDEQLERRGVYLEGRPEMTVEQWVERILIGHIMMHLSSIRASVGVPTA